MPSDLDATGDRPVGNASLRVRIEGTYLMSTDDIMVSDPRGTVCMP